MCERLSAHSQGGSGCAQIRLLTPIAVKAAAHSDRDGRRSCFYRVINNSWFMAEDLGDFSQVIEDNIFYIVPGSMEGIGGERTDGAYSIYTLDENGKPQWGMGVGSADGPKKVPNYFTGLTRDIILEDLDGVAYEDFVITDSARLYTVFVWAKCADGEDIFITYPARPEFVGLENRGQYTLPELQQILTKMAMES